MKRRSIQEICLCFLLIAIVGVNSLAVTPKPLFLDMRFRKGFLLSYPDSSKGRTVEAVLDFGDPNNKPVWRLCQWGTKHSLANAKCLRFHNYDIAYENKGKKVLVGAENSVKRDLILQINGKAEYGQMVRRHGESWPHLLIEQDDVDIHFFRFVNQIHLHLEANLLKSEHFELDGYTPNLHTAQFQLTLIVQDRNRESAGYGDFIWFNVQIYDERYRSSPLYSAKDTADPSAKMIYAPPTHVYTNESLHDGQWIKFDKGLYPFIQEALSEARRKGYLQTSPSNDDFAISSVILGWEVPGISSIQMQVRDLSLVVSLRSDQ